jgi:hypothetical protein
MERAKDQFWIPAPMIGSTFNGFDQTANFGSLTETEIAVSIGYHKSDPRTLSSKNLRNETVMKRGARPLVRSSLRHQLCAVPDALPSRARCGQAHRRRHRL